MDDSTRESSWEARPMDLDTVPREWDVIVIGGGVTGAGILNEAAATGLRVLLVERHDFAWGTSSRSSKMVHGGFRYLKEGKIALTRIAVRERERLLREAPGLVEPLGFLLPVYKDRGLSRWTLEIGLSIYDLFAGRKDHRFFGLEAFSMMAAHLKQDNLVGGFRFTDAQVDDARLVLRLIDEACESGPDVMALNYVTVNRIRKNSAGHVKGIDLSDTETGEEHSLSAPVVINATGFEAETFHRSPDPGCHLRPLRGSHLVFPMWCLPTALAVSLIFPEDGRYGFVCPWEGRLLVGTTDLDHRHDPSLEPAIRPDEAAYLMEGLQETFSDGQFPEEACIASFAGVRPVLSRGDNTAPSHESREHAIWADKGLITVTGGKLTTFRKVAQDTLKAAAPFLQGATTEPRKKGSGFMPVSTGDETGHPLPAEVRRRLYGRYGKAATQLIREAAPKDLDAIPGTLTLWAELPFTAAREHIRHLSDLLLRRVRIGILCHEGGAQFLDRVEAICRPVLPWDSARWSKERAAYARLWQDKYAPPKWG